MRNNMFNKVLVVLAVSVSGITLSGEAFSQTFDGGALDEVVVTGSKPTYQANFANSAGDVGSGLSESALSALEGRQMTTTVTTNKNGEISTETTTSDVLGGGSSGAGAATVDSAAAGQASADAQKAEEKTAAEEKKEEEKKEDLTQYDGLYDGRHIMPDIMAMHCRIKGEEVAQNPDLFIDCIKQYVSEMNNPDASAKAEAEREYEMLKYKVLTDAGSTAMTKSVAVNNNNKAMDETTQAQSNLPTESDDNKGIMASLMFVTNMMNDIRELMVEQLKYDVISGIGDIDPAIVMTQETDKSKKEEKSTSGTEAKGPDYNVTEVKTKVE